MSAIPTYDVLFSPSWKILVCTLILLLIPSICFQLIYKGGGKRTGLQLKQKTHERNKTNVTLVRQNTSRFLAPSSSSDGTVGRAARKVSLGFCDYHIHHLKQVMQSAFLYSCSGSVDRHLGLYAFYMLSNLWRRIPSIKLATGFQMFVKAMCDAKCTTLIVSDSS